MLHQVTPAPTRLKQHYARQNRAASAKKDTSQSPWFISLGTPKDSGHFQSCILSHSQDWNSKLLCAEWTKLGQGGVILPALPHFCKSTPALGTSLWGGFSNSSPGPDTQLLVGHVQQHQQPLEPPLANSGIPKLQDNAHQLRWSHPWVL